MASIVASIIVLIKRCGLAQHNGKNETYTVAAGQNQSALACGPYGLLSGITEIDAMFRRNSPNRNLLESVRLTLQGASDLIVESNSHEYAHHEERKRKMPHGAHHAADKDAPEELHPEAIWHLEQS